MKSIGIALVVVVLILVGMNQYQSYKLNKTANDGIEAIQNAVQSSMNKQEELANVKATYSSLRSAIATKRQRDILDGVFSGVTDLNENGRVFGKVLEYPVKDCVADRLSSQCWRGSGSQYIYKTSSGDNIDFRLQNNRFNCTSNCRGID